MIRVVIDETSLAALFHGKAAQMVGNGNGEEIIVKMLLQDIGFDRIQELLNAAKNENVRRRHPK